MMFICWQPNFQGMSTKELRAYVLSHQDDEEAFYYYVDKKTNNNNLKMNSSVALPMPLKGFYKLYFYETCMLSN